MCTVSRRPPAAPPLFFSSDLGRWCWQEPQSSQRPGVEEPGLLGHRRRAAHHADQRQRPGNPAPPCTLFEVGEGHVWLSLQEMASRKVTRTHFEDEDDDDMVRASVWVRLSMTSFQEDAASARLKRRRAGSSLSRRMDGHREVGSVSLPPPARPPSGRPSAVCSQPANQAVLLQQVAHSTCGDSEYNLRSRTVVCGSCGLPSDKPSTCSLTSASRSFRSGGLSEGLLPQSYVFSASAPRKVTPAAAAQTPLLEIHTSLTLSTFPFRLEVGWRAVPSCEPRDCCSTFTRLFILRPQVILQVMRKGFQVERTRMQ